MGLYEAALQGNVDEIAVLLRKRGKVDTVHKGVTILGERIIAISKGTPLLAAVGNGHVAAAALLLDHGADINRSEEHGVTPLILAAMLGRSEVLDLLIARGADLNRRDRTGSTALHYAITMLQCDCAERLVNAGAGVNIADHYFKPPLHHAIEQWKFAAAMDPAAKPGRTSSARAKSSERIDDNVQRRRSLARLIDLLLDSGADLHGRGLLGATPLHVAAGADDIAMARRLIERGADINRLDDYGSSPLSSAAGHVEMTRFLLQAGADPNAGSTDGVRPLHEAVSREQEDVLVELLKAGADVGAATGLGETPISLAAEKALGSFVQLMVQIGKHDETPQTAETLRQESLQQAVQAGDLALVEKLLNEGADPDAKSHDGTRPLAAASRAGHEKVVELLIASGAKVNAKDHYQKTALHEAAACGHVNVIRALLKAGADVNVVSDEGSEGKAGWTPLIAACHGGHDAAASALLQAGAKVNVRTSHQMTPVLLAAAARNRTLVERLLRAGARQDEITGHFLAMLEFAARAKEPDFQKAVDLVAKRYGVAPLRKPRFKDGAMFNLARSPKTAAILPEVSEELIDQIVAGGEHGRGQARTMVKSLAADLARERATHAAVDELREEMTARGYLPLYNESFVGDLLVLLPTTDPLAAVACLGPWPDGAPRMIRFLQSLAEDQKFVLHGCSYATLILLFPGRIGDPLALAKRLFRLRSDERGVIVHGTNELTATTKELSAALSRRRPLARLWWD